MKVFKVAVWIALTLGLVAVSSVLAAEELSASERSRLRYRLQNIFNEFDLLIQNREADLSDVRRQRREAEALNIYRSIPTETDMAGIERQLRHSAGLHDLEWIGLSKHPSTAMAVPAVPKAIRADQKPPFRLSRGQVAEEVRLTLRVRAPGDPARARARIERWTRSWTAREGRWVESLGFRRSGGVEWEIGARAYRFRPIRFPRIVPPDPFELLPAWVRARPSEFASKEPELWRLASRARELAPKASKHYETRGEFLLNEARFRFYMSVIDRVDADA